MKDLTTEQIIRLIITLAHILRNGYAKNEQVNKNTDNVFTPKDEP